MQDLFKKYLNGQCSLSEVKELFVYFNVPENERPLRELIIQSLENMDVSDDRARYNPAIDETFAAIKRQLNAKKGKIVNIAKRIWFRVAVTVIILVGGFAVYESIKGPKKPQNIVKANGSNQEVEPGSNKAVLTLADGSAISLETAPRGIITRQGDATILKPIDGQIVYTSLNERPTEIYYNTIVTPRGGQYKLLLSDGSRVWLNAASSLRFPATFAGNERKVELTGEGYFEVEKYASMPFRVAVAGKAEVEVLGTHFNVNAYSDEITANTTLLEGSVKVIGLKTRESRIIAPGEQAQIHGDGEITTDRNAHTEQEIAWKNGVFNFYNADIGTVFRQLSRWYDVDIIMERRLTQRRFNGEIQRDLKLTQVLKLLEKNNVFCRLNGKRLIVLK